MISEKKGGRGKPQPPGEKVSCRLFGNTLVDLDADGDAEDDADNDQSRGKARGDAVSDGGRQGGKISCYHVAYLLLRL